MEAVPVDRGSRPAEEEVRPPVTVASWAGLPIKWEGIGNHECNEEAVVSGADLPLNNREGIGNHESNEEVVVNGADISINNKEEAASYADRGTF